jgi:hypothetical protein
MRLIFTSLFALLAVVALQLSARAEIVLTTSTYTQNFDSLGTTSTTSAFSGTTISQIPKLTDWDGARVGGSGTSANLIADNGAGNSGGLYSYGAAGGADRALGALASGTNIMGFGFQLRNNTGAAITSIDIAFTQENWRSSTSNQNTIVAGWSLTSAAVTSSSYLTAASTEFSTVAALNLVGPAPVTTNGALDGNLASNQVSRSASITGLSLAQGESIFFRWTDANDVGNDAGLAIDNFTLTAFSSSAVPEPATLSLLGVAIGLGAVARFRRKS